MQLKQEGASLTSGFMITSFEQYKWAKIGGTVFIVLLCSLLAKPVFSHLFASAHDGTGPSSPKTQVHAVRRDRAASQGEHAHVSAVDQALTEDSRALFEFTSTPTPSFDFVGFGFLCLSFLILLASTLNHVASRCLHSPTRIIVGAKHASVFLATLRLRI
ncbi:hypothetical protein [Acidihalobacter prosperus]